MTETELAPTTLKTGNYSIELAGGGVQIYAVTPDDHKTWVASTSDPQIAMDIVEGLILVETKRFYHPETEPVFETKNPDDAPLPPFLTRARS